MKYILNSAVITSPGIYEYRLISPDEASRWYGDGSGVESTIGYEETAQAVSAILNAPVHVNRRQVTMRPGDEALVFRLTVRLPDPDVKGQIGDTGWIMKNSEIGILTRKE